MLTRKESTTPARIDAELKSLFANLLSVKWFARLGSDKAKRATFIALCLDLSMGGIALTDEEFQANYNFAQSIALAK